MIIRALDINHDWTFGKGKEDFLTGQLAIVQNVHTRLLSFFNNCFFDMEAGIDWFTYLGTPNKNREIILKTRAVILQSYGVVGVNHIDLKVNTISRNALLTYSINTLYTQNYSQTLQVVTNV